MATKFNPHELILTGSHFILQTISIQNYSKKQINSLTIFPLGHDEYTDHFGNQQNTKHGIDVYTGDTYSLYQLAQFASKAITKNGFEVVIKNKGGASIDLDPRELRGAVAEGEKIEHDLEHRLICEAR